MNVRRVVAIVVLAILAVVMPSSASASITPTPETRIGNFELREPTLIGFVVTRTVENHRAKSILCADLASQHPLRWKGMWRFDVAGTELYDARARMWSPALGSFFSIDEFDWHDPNTTLWGWPGQNPLRWSDPFGRGRGAEDSRSAFTQALFDLSPNQLDATAGFGTGLLDNIPLWPIHGSPTLGSLAAAGGLSGQHAPRAGACAGGGDDDNDAANLGRLAGYGVGALALGLKGAGGGGPIAGGGAKLSNISAGQAQRIQNAANRLNTPITLVGSRAGGTATAASDWDYLINASSAVRHSATSSLPGAAVAAEGRAGGSLVDILSGSLDAARPYIVFLPGQ